MPGMLKIVSVIVAPEITAGSATPKRVIIGISAFLKACLK